jgi:hypothetical protein
MYSIQNRMKRTWIVPATFKPDNSVSFDSISIAPGSSAFVQDEHWDSIKKGNQVVEALLTGRNLVVTKAKEDKAARALDADELKNPKSPEAPEDLTEKDDRVQIDSKVELKTVELKDDAPAEVQPKGKK